MQQKQKVTRIWTALVKKNIYTKAKPTFSSSPVKNCSYQCAYDCAQLLHNTAQDSSLLSSRQSS